MRLAFNEFAYKKTKNDCKLGDTFQKNGRFVIADLQIKRSHITRSNCILIQNIFSKRWWFGLQVGILVIADVATKQTVGLIKRTCSRKT